MIFLRYLLSTAIFACFAQCLAVEVENSPPSSYAPINDIDHQFEYFIKRLEKNLDNVSDYDKDRQGSVEKDASTLAVLALVLANHDSDGESKNNAGEMLTVAQKLVASVASYAEAKAVFDKLLSTQSAIGSGEPLEWKPVADLSVLMQQVPIVNNSLRRGVRSRRFKRSIDRTAGLAATLAALAEISALDTTYCADDEDARVWRKICAEMRDAAASVNRAVRNTDQQAAQKGLDLLVETCDKCHLRFRD